MFYADFRPLHAALPHLLPTCPCCLLPVKQLDILGDNSFVIGLLNDQLLPEALDLYNLKTMARDLITDMDVTAHWINREQNVFCDSLARASA